MQKFLVILILAGLSLPVVVGAQPITPPLPRLNLLETLETIANTVFWILLVIAIVALVWAGILFVTAGGSADQIEKARHIVLYAVIGVIVALLAYAIRTFLLRYIGGITPTSEGF